jgi:hypothetical protein
MLVVCNRRCAEQHLFETVQEGLGMHAASVYVALCDVQARSQTALD